MEETMTTRKTIVCTCENCGNEAEMTIKCEEVIIEEPAAPTPPPAAPEKKTLVCTRCGNESEMLVDI